MIQLDDIAHKNPWSKVKRDNLQLTKMIVSILICLLIFLCLLISGLRIFPSNALITKLRKDQRKAEPYLHFVSPAIVCTFIWVCLEIMIFFYYTKSA